MTAERAVLIAAVFVLAGMVKGLIGLGLPTIAIGLLGLVMPPREAAVLLLLPSMVTNVGQLMAGPNVLPLVRRLWPLLIAGVVGTWLSVGTLAGSGRSSVQAVLGAALIVYAIVGLTRYQPRVTPGMERWAGPAVGFLTGLVGGATSVFTVPGVPYLASLGFDRDALVQALGLSFTVSTVALAAGLAWYGAVPWQGAGASVLAVVPALTGMAAGGWLRGRIRPGVFRVCFFAGLLVLGTELLLRGFA